MATNAFVDTLRLAFEGSAEAAGSPDSYIGDAIDLGIRVLDLARDTELTDEEVERLASGAVYTIVVLVGDGDDRWEHLLQLNRVTRLDVSEPEEQVGGVVQGESVVDGVERRMLPVVTTLRAMETARRVLVAGSEEERQAGAGGPTGLKLFVSHAKIDGVPVALSLISMLLQLRRADGSEGADGGFEYFYDVEHLETGEAWEPTLKDQASRGLLIALRTEAYEKRYWCQQEFLLAERNGMPILVVDLRTAQYQDSGLLPFEAVPSVRVHDGNLIRVVLHALSAHLRALRMAKVAHESVRVLPHRPSVYSLAASKKAGSCQEIAYPAPRLAEAYLDAVEPLLGEGVKLVTYDEMREVD